MKSLLRSLLSTCSSSAAAATSSPPSPPPPKPPKHLFSDASGTSATSSSSSSSSQDYSLQSSLSLQTLPSVPSLQTYLPKEETLGGTACHVIHLRLDPLTGPAPVSALALHRSLLYAAFSHEIYVFDANNDTNKAIDTFNRDGLAFGVVKSITFRDERVFTAHQDGRIRVWRISVAKRHDLFATLPTPRDYLRHFIFPHNYVKIRRHKKRLWIEHNDAVSGLVFIDDLLCSVSWDRSLKIWRASDFKCLESAQVHEDAVNAVAVGSDGSIYTASADRRIKVWARPIGTCKKHILIATLEKHKSAVNALALNSDGTVLFSGACDRSILVWEREDSANHMVVSGALRGHSKAILCLINVCDVLFSGSADRTVRIWRRGNDGRFCCLSILDGHDKPVKALAAIKEDESEGGGFKVFSGSFSGEIKVWRVMVPNQTNMLYSNFSKFIT